MGIGSKLVRAGLDDCRRAGFKVMAVLGHPSYYPRFGFAPSVKYGVKSEYVDAPPEASMALEFKPVPLASAQGFYVALQARV